MNRSTYIILLMSTLLFACKKQEGKSNETFIRNYYGTAYKIVKSDTVTLLDAHVRMKTGNGKTIFTSALIPEANNEFDTHDEANYMQIDILQRKEYKPYADTLEFVYYRWGSDTVEWYYNGIIK